MKVRDTSGSGAGNGNPAGMAAGPPPSGTPSRPPTGGGGGLGGLGGLAGAAGGLRVEPPDASGRRRVPELVLGIFLVAGCALGAVLIAAAGRERTPVLTLSGDIERGHVLTEDDLKVVYLGSDSPVAYVRDGDEEEVVGKAALADLGAGTILTSRQFAEPQTLSGEGEGVVGFELEIGQLPSRNLTTGDLVNVIVGEGLTGEASQVVADAAVIVEVEKIEESAGQSERWWVAVKARESDADALGQASLGNNPVKLVLVRR
jgi:hypothetical protein